MTRAAESVLVIDAQQGRVGDSRVVGVEAYDEPTSFCWGDPLQAWREDRPHFVQAAKQLVGSPELTIYPPVAPAAAALKLVLNPYLSMDVVPVSGQTVEVRVQRIDVHDIAVTREDGSTFNDRGLYRVYRQEAGAYVPIGSGGEAYAFPTNTGIDVPPGKYRLEVECVSADCTTRVQTHDLDLP